jgi:hypothetical protein
VQIQSDDLEAWWGVIGGEVGVGLGLGREVCMVVNSWKIAYCACRASRSTLPT